MLLQGFTGWVILYLLIATILLWIFLYLASWLIISKSYASDKKVVLLLSAFLIVLLVGVVSGAIGSVLTSIGDLLVSIRIDGGGRNYMGDLVPIIAFLLFIVILKWICTMDWVKAVWVSLIGIFLLYILYSVVPELDLYQYL